MNSQFKTTFSELYDLLRKANLELLTPEMARRTVAEFLQHSGTRVETLEPDQLDLLSRLAPLIARLAHLCPKEEFTNALLDGELPPIQLTETEMRDLRA